ncbi:small, acid-soluble spore protein, H family [Bacillus luteolus]|uniref:Small, acid-soluble spore protein H n=1 Tax=Litchfieldia luteola TaxID=682179 RepID=A0ABR9QKG0_9BACI|nr:small, acid-soluble spore protein, H family [Cytobacillus luteolus]MBE4908995.1 small, acid-soluble spore protein, H family [Cytobacillus luteolus]MBP1941854.1 small acid-soluble spore protein H (minor) [Cytobacillus luteolus]
MDLNRARQIISSPEEIRVTYNGVAVRLIETDETNNTVSIRPETNPEDLMQLPANELVEG